MIEKVNLAAVVTDDQSGKRLDQALATLFPDYSRARLQQWIKKGTVLVNDSPLRQRDRIQTGDRIRISADLDDATNCSPEAIPLHIIHEDEDLIVLNKPAGLVVHPGAGNREHTLLNALLHHAPELKLLPRAGIVQRLDKDTTGIMVVARNAQSHAYLVQQLQSRKIRRHYLALVNGIVTAGGKVETPIGRHPVQRTRMAVVEKGKMAVTHYRVVKKYPAHTLLRVQLETGRTHQIRVHMSSIHHPVTGDPVYSGGKRFPKGINDTLRKALQDFHRQALHACALGLVHRLTGQECNWEAPIPADFQTLLQLLDREAG